MTRRPCVSSVVNAWSHRSWRTGARGLGMSSGAAAALAGVPRVVFLAKLADYGIATFTLSADELAEDLARA